MENKKNKVEFKRRCLGCEKELINNQKAFCNADCEFVYRNRCHYILVVDKKIEADVYAANPQSAASKLEAMGYAGGRLYLLVDNIENLRR